jgi:Protein of unknown function (DUF3253)
MTEANFAPERIEAAIVSIVQQRGAGSSACPSDVARALSPDHWRALMPQVRAVASQLAQQGKIEISQRGRAVSPVGPWTGPIRLRLPPG